MGKLGYTLNGFYFVNGSDNLERFGVIFCQFKPPPAQVNKSKSRYVDGTIFVHILICFVVVSIEVRLRINKKYISHRLRIYSYDDVD